MVYFRRVVVSIILLLAITALQSCDMNKDPEGLTVTFNVDDILEIDTITGLETGETVELVEIRQEDKIFLGWKDQEDTLYLDEITVTENVILTPVFERVNDVLTYRTVENEYYPDTVVITSYTGDAKRLLIPEKIEGLIVTGIGREAFADRIVEDLILPRTAISLASLAFAGAPNLDRLTFYGRYAGYDLRFFSSFDYYDILDDYATECSIIEEDPESAYKVFSTGCPIHKTLSKTDPVYMPGEDEPLYGYEVVVDFAYYDQGITHNAWSAGVFSQSTLRSVMIPAEVTVVSPTTFLDAATLEEIIVEEGNEHYTSVDGVLYDQDIETLYLYPAGKTDVTYTLPETVHTLADLALNVSYTPYLQEIKTADDHPFYQSKDGVLYDKEMHTLYAYPSGRTADVMTVDPAVKTIGPYAFQYAHHLSQVILPAGLERIERGAFRMSALESITIPESVHLIGSQALYGIEALDVVIFEKSIDDVSSLNILGTPFENGKVLTIYVPDDSYDTYLRLDNLGHLGEEVIRPISEYEN